MALFAAPLLLALGLAAPARLAVVGPPDRTGAPGEGPDARALALAAGNAGVVPAADAAKLVSLASPPEKLERALAEGEAAYFRLDLETAQARLTVATGDLALWLPLRPVAGTLERALATAAAVRRAKGDAAGEEELLVTLAELTGARADAVPEARFPPPLVAAYRAACARLAGGPLPVFPRALLDRWAGRLNVRYLLAAGPAAGGGLALEVWDAEKHVRAAGPVTVASRLDVRLDETVEKLLAEAKLVAPVSTEGRVAWYRRWWIWAGVGAVAAGTATAVVLARRPVAGPEGSLDTLHLPR